MAGITILTGTERQNAEQTDQVEKYHVANMLSIRKEKYLRKCINESDIFLLVCILLQNSIMSHRIVSHLYAIV